MRPIAFFRLKLKVLSAINIKLIITDTLFVMVFLFNSALCELCAI